MHPLTRTALPQRCPLCGTSFLAHALLVRHQQTSGCGRIWSALEEEPIFRRHGLSGRRDGQVHPKRLKVSPAVYLPIASRLKGGKSGSTDSSDVRRKVPRSMSPSGSASRLTTSQSPSSHFTESDPCHPAISVSDTPTSGPTIAGETSGIVAHAIQSPDPVGIPPPPPGNSPAFTLGLDDAPSTDGEPLAEIPNGPGASVPVPTNCVDDLPLSVRRSRRNGLNPVNDLLPATFAENPRLSEKDTMLARHKAHRSTMPKPPKVVKPTAFLGPTNSFGLRRRYYGCSLPTHDPEEYLELQDLYESHHTSVIPEKQPSSPFGPFPNLSSFQLGEWYLTAGSQVSMDGLKRLVKIAQGQDFAAEILKANWTKIFDQLGGPKGSVEGVVSREDDWMDDDGWKSTPISIRVPFKKGPEIRTVGTLYHRSIVSIVQQKILNSDQRFFHYDPFEILWHRNGLTARFKTILYLVVPALVSSLD
ncbi:hypothetical protein NMY22_g16721 [Coprinellus aureogranulatus]|nr:hypothetical protein NMY22_g16721 [Coprinellus aureogranulatus]